MIEYTSLLMEYDGIKILVNLNHTIEEPEIYEFVKQISNSVDKITIRRETGTENLYFLRSP